MFGEESPTHFQLDLMQEVLPVAVLALLGVLAALLLFQLLVRRAPIHFLRAVFFVDLALALAVSAFLIWASMHRFGDFGFLAVVLVALVAKQLVEGVLLARIVAVAEGMAEEPGPVVPAATAPGTDAPPGEATSAPATRWNAAVLAWLAVLPPFAVLPVYLLASWVYPTAFDESFLLNLLAFVLLVLAGAGVLASLALGIRNVVRLVRRMRELGARKRARRLAGFAWLHPAAWALGILVGLLAFLGWIALTLLELEGTDLALAILLVPFAFVQSAAVLCAANAPCEAGLKAEAAERRPTASGQV